MDDFAIRAGIAGIAVAAMAAPLGCFVVWRRMAYFGDTLAHAALLGIALGLFAGIHPLAGVAVTSITVAVLLYAFGRERRFAVDTLLGILAHSGLALGLVAIALMPTVRVDLLAYLFGDILAVSTGETATIAGGAAIVLTATALLWRRLLALTVHEDLARTEGVPVERVKLAFLLLLAFTVALAMKVVGVLLITALLIIPPAAARAFAASPEAMAGAGIAIGGAAVALGLGASFAVDVPTGPAIVAAAFALFLASVLGARLRARR